MADLTNRALIFAAEAHGSIGQTRKYTGEPYIVHPIEVMMLVRAHDGSEAMQAAALLHDVVEDTTQTLADVFNAFGASVANLVDELTEPKRDGNRATRKAAEVERLSKISGCGQTIKLADLISNTRSIVQHDPGFAKVYLREKAALLDVLTKGNPALLEMAWALMPIRS